MVLHSFAEFLHPDITIPDRSPRYWYEGTCPHTGDRVTLPRTALAEAIAQGLMHHLAQAKQVHAEGKMYGVLLVATPEGDRAVLKAFSGLLNGESKVAGWVPPIPGREQVADVEAHTLAQLNAIKTELLALQHRPEPPQYDALKAEFEAQWQALSQRHRDRKLHRQQHRQQLGDRPTPAAAQQFAALEAASRQDGLERRRFKQHRAAVLQPLQQQVEQIRDRIRELKQQRKALSRQLQSQMHTAYWLANFAGQARSLTQLMPAHTIPTGTGDCCAPKLLHYAATHHLTPLALAEFWWGAASTQGDKVPGEFYGACAERCQPLMGFLLSGLSNRSAPARPEDLALPVLYEDDWLVAIHKPAGLLSVPGRYRHTQDSVLSRLRCLWPEGDRLSAVHRLDQDTSGILLLAKDQDSDRALKQQFQHHQVHKVYEAIVVGTVQPREGVIELPLWGDPSDRPRQTVNEQRGKPSLTKFRILAQEGQFTRVEFTPVTGRTHQLRVHAADAKGLGAPIWGDRLYGDAATDPIPTDRLHLHAKALAFSHPQSGQWIQLHAQPPF